MLLVRLFETKKEKITKKRIKTFKNDKKAKSPQKGVQNAFATV